MLHLGWPGLHTSLRTRNNSYSSHTSRITYNSHAELPRAAMATRWSHWVEGFHTNNDVPYPSNGHNGNVIRMKETLKSSLVSDSVTPNKQRLSVQFPVSTLLTFENKLKDETC